MNDYSSYSSAPPSEASTSAVAAAAAYNNARCQSTIDNVTRWLQQYESEAEASKSRTNLFEAEITKRLALLRPPGANTPSSMSRNASELSITYRQDQMASPAPSHTMPMVSYNRPFGFGEPGEGRIVSSASSSNKRVWDTCPAVSSKQPRISDPTLVTDIPFQPAPSFTSLASSNMGGAHKSDSGMLTPPSSAANSTDIAPPLPPRESITSTGTVVPSGESGAPAPPLPPRPPGLVTSGVELHMSSPTPSTTSNFAISFHVSQPNKPVNQWYQLQPQQQQQVFFSPDHRGSSMPPAPPGSVASSALFSPDTRVRSLPQGGATAASVRSNNSLFRQHFATRPSHLPPNGGQFPPQFWSQQPMSSAGQSFASQSHGVSNANYSVFPDLSPNGTDSQAGLSDYGSVSFNGSNYALYDTQQLVTSTSNLEIGGGNGNGNQISTRHMYVQGAALQRRPRQVHTSPLPERRQRNSARLEDGTMVTGGSGREAYSNSRNYSSEAFKFFMEQHVENLIKSCAQRKERQQQLLAVLASQNSTPDMERSFRAAHYKRETTYLRLKRARMQISFFEPLKTLGIGAFGEVSLVRKRDTGKFYAMKTLRKADVIKRNQVAHVKAERDILAEANSDWVVKLFFSFQDRENLYFIMDYIPGGDLMNLLIKMGVFPEPMARFYTAELVAALEYVHSMGFIHRDIKPDNVLIDREGHVKLTDFGLCTGFRWTHQSNRYAKIRPEEPIWIYAPASHAELPESSSSSTASSLTLPHRHRRVHSLVGTPNYIAPEVVLKSGYNHSCDWWSVGVILYEMLVGRPPFLSETPAETQYKIIHWKQYLSFPCATLSPAASDLILSLIRDADTRLGAFGGAADIKAHTFFNNIDFENLRKQPAVYVPILKSDIDTSNFDPASQGGQPSYSEQTTPTGTVPNLGPAAEFYEFTFRRFCEDAGYHPGHLPFFMQALTTELASAPSPNLGASVVTSKPPLPPPLPPRPGQVASSPSVASKPLPPTAPIAPSSSSSSAAAAAPSSTNNGSSAIESSNPTFV